MRGTSKRWALLLHRARGFARRFLGAPWSSARFVAQEGVSLKEGPRGPSPTRAAARGARLLPGGFVEEQGAPPRAGRARCNATSHYSPCLWQSSACTLSTCSPGVAIARKMPANYFRCFRQPPYLWFVFNAAGVRLWADWPFLCTGSAPLARLWPEARNLAGSLPAASGPKRKGHTKPHAWWKHTEGASHSTSPPVEARSQALPSCLKHDTLGPTQLLHNSASMPHRVCP